MNRIAQSIKNRLSLRPPQADSLNILAGLTDKLTLQKNGDLSAALEIVKSAYPTCADFERNFPSLCFALATGVGKTRLMGAIKFKNVVYEYSLAKAIQDGFVKEPAVATRKDFNPSQYSSDELDRIKLEDGIRIHEDTKVALDIYARDNRVKPVRPFVLVVAQDTTHAGKLRHLIISNAFFEGYYADKVMEIHSSQTGSEKEDNIAQLISLEKPENKIEIVIHVNMLKEGWDVTNLYTIIPLRTATSMTLREQTIGRGLRLPYSKRTGVDKVDKLTIVAHDKFQEIIDAANQSGSIIKRQNIIEIPRITIQQSNEVTSGFKDFDLDTRNLNYQPVSEEILVKKLREQEDGVDIVIGKGRIVFDRPEKIIVNELINYPEIDYDDQSDLLFKLVGKAIEKFRTYLDDDKLMNVVQFHKKEIGSYIYSQMMQHFYFETPSYEKPIVKPFTRIEEHNFSKYTKDSIHHFTETITPTNAIPNKNI